MRDHSLVTVGRVIKAHGLRGEVVVHLLSDVPGRLDAGTEVVLAGRPTRIVGSRPHQGRMLVHFDGVTDRTAAERLRGQAIEAPPADVSQADTYYAHELVGMAVTDADGDRLGNVAAVVEIPAAAGYDLLEVVRDNGTAWLLPAVDEYVEVRVGRDGAAHLVLTDPPAGLVDEA